MLCVLCVYGKNHARLTHESTPPLTPIAHADDTTRVHLTTTSNEPGSDYINANYVCVSAERLQTRPSLLWPWMLLL